MALPTATPAYEPIRKVAIICSKGSLDMAYPGLILANGARMSGIDVTLFFTFWGLDIVTKEKIDHLHVSSVGNPSMGLPTMVGGLPGMEWLTTRKIGRKIEGLDVPSVSELVETLDDAGAELYACRLAVDMMGLGKDDLVPQVRDVISSMDFFDKARGGNFIFI